MFWCLSLCREALWSIGKRHSDMVIPNGLTEEPFGCSVILTRNLPEYIRHEEARRTNGPASD